MADLLQHRRQMLLKDKQNVLEKITIINQRLANTLPLSISKELFAEGNDLHQELERINENLEIINNKLEALESMNTAVVNPSNLIDSNVTVHTINLDTSMPESTTEYNISDSTDTSHETTQPVMIEGRYVRNQRSTKQQDCLNIDLNGHIYQIYGKREIARANLETLFRCKNRTCLGRVKVIGYEIGLVQAGDIAKITEIRQHTANKCRGLRKRWQRDFLKDLWHRRIIAGGEPLTHRAFLPNWNYGSELYAFRHRRHGEDKENEHFIKALTNPTFFTRKDIADDASYAQPSLEKEIESHEDNVELAKEGDELLYNIVTGYFSLQFPKAPSEFIEAITNSLINDDILAEAATSLGMQHLVRTGEFPPYSSTLAESLKACLVILSPEQDVLPFRNPLGIVTDYAKKYLKAEMVEPRVMHKSGVNSATPLYYVGIYADQKLIGECAGETLSTAVDLASQASLLRLWGASPEVLMLNVAFNQQDLSKVAKNHSIFDIVNESADLSCYSDEELNYDPLDIVNIANNYKSIEKELGRPRIKHLRHKFSRGTLVLFY